MGFEVEVRVCGEHSSCYAVDVAEGRIDVAGVWHFEWRAEERVWALSPPRGAGDVLIPVKEGAPEVKTLGDASVPGLVMSDIAYKILTLGFPLAT